MSSDKIYMQTSKQIDKHRQIDIHTHTHTNAHTYPVKTVLNWLSEMLKTEWIHGYYYLR